MGARVVREGLSGGIQEMWLKGKYEALVKAFPGQREGT